MLNNLLNNVQTIVILLTVIVLVGVYAFTLYKKYKEQGKDIALKDLRETAYLLFLRAEERFGPKTGPNKMAWAVKQFYNKVAPDIIKQYLSGDTVEQFLRETFDNGYEKLKDLLDDGKINNSYLETLMEEDPEAARVFAKQNNLVPKD